ncbi:MAG: hypothetical protein HY736_08540, partial [Verrucomicrobia bacterium]|nr:hypothetical protein [Verrucomicrobiota bacterium]
MLALAVACIFADPLAGAEKKTEAPAETPRTFRVCLVSGANESKPYSTDTSLRAMADYLQTEHKMVCDVLVVNAAGTGFDGVERLLDADAAVFFV